MSSGRRQQGFTYLAALIFVGLAGLGLAVTGELWSHARQREKETELVWIGEQFRQAIGLYYHRTPGALKRYPERLEDLLEDKRFPTVQRYLRRIYADPLTGKDQWDLVSAPGGGIMGVRTTARGSPIRRLGDARSYADWQFVYEPPAAVRSGSQRP